MGRIYFHTHLVHACFDPELYSVALIVPSRKLREERFTEVLRLHDLALQQKCACKYWVSKEEVDEFLEMNLAEPLIDDRDEIFIPTRHLVVKMAAKTPRAHTIEKAHMERGVFSDNGKMADLLECGHYELIEQYHDIEVEERYRLFGISVGKALLKLKKASDTLGTLEGQAGRYAEQVLLQQADRVKLETSTPDLFEGEPVLSYIGLDQRTSVSKNILTNKG